MKKFLSTAVALGAVAGLAATASALELKVTGHYNVDGYYINSGNAAAGGGGVLPWDLEATTRAERNFLCGMLGLACTAGQDLEPKNDDFYWHEFRFDPTLIVNDKVQIKSDIRLVDSNSVWGSQDDLQRFDGGGVRVNKLWLVYDSPIGKWEVGRRPAGAWMGPYINSGTAADRIMWWAPAMDNFKAYAFLQKSTERDGYMALEDDADNDYYEVAGGWQGEGIKAWLGLGTRQDNGANVDMWRIKGYGEFGINETFSLAAEFDYKWGDQGPNDEIDIKSWAGIISGMGNFGDLSASLHYAYLSGQNDDATENTAYDVTHGTGDDFEPLYILTGSATNILNGDLGPNLVGTAVRTSGAHAVVALADFKASEDLTLHGGLGWGKADETDWLGPNVDDDYGWEVDLGLAYKLYENLTYEVHFGWWLVGDFAELGDSDIETQDIWLLSHHLSMKF